MTEVVERNAAAAISVKNVTPATIHAGCILFIETG